MRVFWRILAVFGGLVLLLIVAVAIAVRTIDVNDFRVPIQSRVKDATGRDLAIRGGIDLELSLSPTLVLDDVTLGNASWGKSPQMLVAKRVEAQIALLPLLQRRFDIVRFTLVEPIIALETDRAGKGNWEFGAGTSTSSSAADRTGNTFAIGDLSIKDGALTYRDGGTGKVTNVAIESLSLHARDAQSPVSANFRGRVDDIALALEGDLGPLDTLVQHRWPYPVSMKGEINGQSASIATKLRVEGPTVNFDELQIGTGRSTLQGQLALTRGAPRSRLVIHLTTASLALADLPLGRKLAAAKSTAGARGKTLFADVPIDFAALRASDADGDISVGQLLLADGHKIDNVHAKFTLRDGKLDAPRLQGSVFGGTGEARLTIDAAHENTLTLHLEAKGLDLGALLAAFGMKREVRGGRTEILLDIATSGVSPHQWASGATGTATALVGPATLVHTKLDLESPLNRLADAVNPFHRVDTSTELQCAVVRLPLKNGVAQIDRSIALETKKFGASASGTLDFRSETLDLAIKPRVRQGIPIEVPQVAELVRFRGPFIAPSVAIDAVASATTIARLGAAIYSGGLSLVGEALLSGAVAADGGPCQIALGRKPAAGDTAAGLSETREPRAPLVDNIGKTIGRVLGR